MVSSKKIKIIEIIVFLFLILFPFGQIIRTNLGFLGLNIPLHPIDLIAGMAFLAFLIGDYKKPKAIKYIIAFLGISLFSYLISYIIFGAKEVYLGGLYLLRLFVYTSLFVIAWNISTNKNFSKTIFNSLIVITSAVALFGFIQYFFYPDARNFTIWGWDDHLYRLFSTFLDPGFTSIILVFGFLATLVKYWGEKDKRILFVLVVLLLAIALTYSRAGYLALIGGSFISFFLGKNLKKFLLFFGVFLLIIVFLPRPGGEGVKLERTASVILRIEDYQDTLTIFRESPLLGVGYNNMCYARAKYLGKIDLDSHACSGSASSLLLILATTGVVGFLIFLTLIYKIILNTKRDSYGLVFLSSLVALIIHSSFVNSLFYPWVMGWMGLLLAISLKPSKE